MANTIKLLFWLHHSKKNKEGLVPLMTRLSFKGKQVNKASGYYIKPTLWHLQKQKMKGNDDLAKDINEWIDSRGSRVRELFKNLSETSSINLPSIMSQLFIEPTTELTLLDVISKFNTNLKERVNKDYTYSTYEKYIITEKKIKAFLKNSPYDKYLSLKAVDVNFIMEFDHYLRVVDGNQHNTAVKYCINLKRILNVAVLQGLLTFNPLNGYKTAFKDTPQIYLSQEEVNKLENIRLDKPSYTLVRDLFIFQCYTGLAYTDLVSLCQNDIHRDHQGRSWIIKPRQKNGIISTIPILLKSQEIMNKYSGKQSAERKMVFPSYSIQKYNQYICEIGVLAGLDKRLSSHCGRRTFGNIALSKGISLNVISKILGHSNTIITQRIYAITTQNIISLEIGKLG